MSTTLPSALRGLAIHDPRIDADSLWASESSFTQAGLVPSTPDPAQPSRVALGASGTMLSTDDVQITIRKGGMVEPDGASMLWRPVSGSARGWNIPNIITGFSQVRTHTRRMGDLITMSDGGILGVCTVDDDDGDRVEALYYDPEDRTWTDVTVSTESLDHLWRPCLVVLPARSSETPRVLLFYLVWAEASATVQVNVRTTTDGVTWSTYDTSVLPTALDVSGTIDASYLAVEAEYLAGQILLLVELYDSSLSGTYRHTWYQYASADLGHSFARVDALDGQDPSAGGDGGGRYTRVLRCDEKLQIYYINPYADAGVSRRVLGSAWDSMATAQETTVTTTAAAELEEDTIAEGGLGVCIDDDGVIYVHLQRVTSPFSGYAFMSADGGETWSALGASQPYWYTTGVASTIRRISTTSQKGRIVVLFDVDASDLTLPATGRVCAVTLGGYSTMTMPRPPALPEQIRMRVQPTDTYIPIHMPEDLSSTARTTSGYPIRTILPGFLLLETDPGDQEYYATTVTLSSAGFLVIFDLQVVEGGSIYASECAIIITSDNGVSRSKVGLYFTTDSIRVIDLISGGSIGGNIPLSNTYPAQVLIALEQDSADTNATRMRVWIRKRSVSDPLDEDHVWEEKCASDTIDTDPTSWAICKVQWGHITSPAVQTTSRWRLMTVLDNQDDMLTGVNSLIDWLDNMQSNLHGRGMAAEGVDILHGLRVTAEGGPAERDHTWLITRSYTHGWASMLPTAPPGRSWRSTQVAHDEVITFDLVKAYDTTYMPEVLVLGLFGCNWATGRLLGVDASGATTSLGTIDLRTGHAGLEYVREGHRIRPASTAAPTEGRYIFANEHDGGIFALSSTVMRRIRRHTAGCWQGQGVATVKRPMIELEGVSTDTDPTSGTGHIWARSAVMVVRLDEGTAFRGLALEVDGLGEGVSHPDGYFEVQRMLLGGAHLFADDYSHGRTYELRPNIIVTTSRDGTRLRRVEGVPRRVAVFRWTDPVDTSAVEQTSPAPRGVVAKDGGPVVATLGETLHSLAGVVCAVYREGGLVLYLPRISTEGTGPVISTQATGPDGFILGAITDAAAIEAMLGEELYDELVQGMEITIEEELF